MRLAALAISILLASCASLSPKSNLLAINDHRGDVKLIDYVPSNDIRVFADIAFTTSEIELVKVSYREHIDRWEDYFDTKVPSYDIVIFPEEYYPCPTSREPNRTVYGCSHNNIRVVYVGARDDYTCPALFHEFCHIGGVSSIADYDAEHKDPRWVNWMRIRDTVVNDIIQKRPR